MLGLNKAVNRAGRSALARYEKRARAWRHRVLRPFFLVFLALVVAFSVAGSVVSGEPKFWLGLLAGATLAMYVALRESPPAHIENWRTGSWGERRTKRALRPLRRKLWTIWHDLDGGHGANIDHVVLGPAGVFLLDTKNYSGEARIEGGELKVRWLEDPEDGWECRGLVSRMRAASADLSERIEAGTGARVWVQPVVVLWMRFPQRFVEVSDDRSAVFFVEGKALAEWLGQRSSSARSFDTEAVGKFLDGLHLS